ncbi:MAG TPA: kelch repeat-containing protein [Terriglobia bacterium]|nr:kelch repeat-containing protein [Terriglobia bacterium]
MKTRIITARATLLVVLLLCLWTALQFGTTGSRWYKLGPAARYQQTAVYDSNSGTMVIFGGQHTYNEQNYDDVWWANNVTTAACLPPCALQWTHPSGIVANAPSARFGHTAVYDAVNLRMVVFGGAGGVTSPAPCLNDAYVLEDAPGTSGTTQWDALSPKGSPPPVRYSHNAVYDANDNEMIVFGGNNCSTTYYNDVWVLTNANGLGGTPTWTQLSPSGPAPGPRAYASAVYDAADDIMMVFGGYDGSLDGDLWVLNHAGGVSGSPAWVQLNPTGTTPSARYQHSAVYDAADNRMIIYGGHTKKAAEITETWVLANANGLGGAPFWTLTSSDGPQRALHSAIYDPATNKMVIFGGQVPKSVNGNPTEDHVWVLNDANGL